MVTNWHYRVCIQDDEIGMLVRSYNLNQQLLQRHYEEQDENAMRFPVSDLPNKALADGDAGAGGGA